MSWIQTYTGKSLDLLSPWAGDVDLRDIAHALARINRYNGHTSRPYSVAEHCVLVGYALERDYPGEHWLPVAGLLHDAAEAYVGDLIYPLWRALSPKAAAEIKAIMADVDSAIGRALGLPENVDIHDARVRNADMRILLDERAALLAPPPKPWVVDGMEPLRVTINAFDPDRAEMLFAERLSQALAYARRHS